ncbi:unnamed protein product [Eruca vesicaria subsp. sativa]|uniref:RING-type E3 ubiquitin transferase n=1 Tax=Eruca vesicaria subsp. sativa TaxID=29727 RepID=A0ABC8L432_ERUVS|nr:unnamed protein product [Eruca vesicaria subsp. sativa]
MGEKRSARSLNEHLALPPPPSPGVAVAINGKKKSKYVTFWALEKLIPQGFSDFKLIHVRPPITYIVTPMGKAISISEARAEVVSDYRREADSKTNEMLLPYKNMFERRKVRVEILVLESHDPVAAIAEEIAGTGVTKLVIGISVPGFFTKKIDMASLIATAVPRFCTVYVVSKGRLASVRPSDSESSGRITFERMERDSSTSSSPDSSSPRAHSRNNHEIANMDGGAVIPANYSFVSHQASNMSDGHPSVHSTTDNNQKLRAELKHVQDMYATTQTETAEAFQKVIVRAFEPHRPCNFNVMLHFLFLFGFWLQLTELNKRRYEESEKLMKLREKEEEAKDSASKEKQRYEETMKEVKKVKELMMKEALRRREVEIKAERHAKEKDKLHASLISPGIQYQYYSWEEIEVATSNFSEELKIGVGSYGTVYKCNLHHTIGAVKVLHAGETQLSKQFDQELEILSKIRHPHLVLLLGACPERGCLVYEYMDNGSLDDRLMQVNNTPPIPWFNRFKIALEVASALVFLHKTKPRPIIHRDLKPGNILLDHNFVSKLGDVGLSTMVNQDDNSSKLTVLKKTNPVGTLCYIDPEYQRTGIISPKSDVYSLGIVILQLITAKPAIGITHKVEEAIGDDAEFMALLDMKAGPWPISETRELAALGLWCTELRRRDRPDLKDLIIPTLERLWKVVDKAQNLRGKTPSGPPSHFICPLLKGVMNEPCVAADGYTYDREAIQNWLRENDTSPVTNLELPDKNLLANYTLYSAIMEWKSNKQ